METSINMLSRSDAVPRLVLTGGPGGGKTTLMETLRAEGDRWLLVPEAAPLLFRAGLDGRGWAGQSGTGAGMDRKVGASRSTIGVPDDGGFTSHGFDQQASQRARRHHRVSR